MTAEDTRYAGGQGIAITRRIWREFGAVGVSRINDEFVSGIERVVHRPFHNLILHQGGFIGEAELSFDGHPKPLCIPAPESRGLYRGQFLARPRGQLKA